MVVLDPSFQIRPET